MSTTSTPAVTLTSLTQVIGSEDAAVSVNAATLGFYGVTPVAQHAAIANPTDAATAITQQVLILDALRALGLIAT